MLPILAVSGGVFTQLTVIFPELNDEEFGSEMNQMNYYDY